MAHKFCNSLNPLTTDDEYNHHQNLAACYQLTQSILKIGFVLEEMVGHGEVGGCTVLGDSAWRLLQLAIEMAWSALDRMTHSSVFFFCTNECRKRSFHLVGIPFLGSLQSGGAFSCGARL